MALHNPAPMPVRCALLAVLAWAVVSCPTAAEEELCELRLTSCPEALDGDTIVVPEKVVGLTSEILACDVTEGLEDLEISGGPPSIMFVIDNSGSMSGLGSPPNDQMGSRFSVTLALLDQIYAAAPNAEVGVAVFQNILYFHEDDDPLFTALPGNVDGVSTQAYIPLTQLNETLSGGQSGIGKLKELMAIDTTTGQLHDGSVEDYVHLKHTPSHGSYMDLYTNINVGFKAAKHAFQSAANPPERQFIIFLSDGEPKGSDQAGENTTWFAQGDSMPTTYTVFFTPDNTAPAILQTMTTNIRNNGYSVTNPESDLWTIETNHQTLLDLLSTEVLSPILQIVQGVPTKMVVNGTSSSTMRRDTSFAFAERFPLNEDTTSFHLDLSYTYTNKSTGAAYDTTVGIDFTVIRSADAGTTAPRNVAYECWAGPTLDLLYNGQPVTAVEERMRQLQVRFSTGDPNVDAVVTTASSSLDSEQVTLSQSAQYWTGTFRRTVGTAGSAADGTLQHTVDDSIVVVYRNPVLPLDSLRIAVPYVPNLTAIPVTATLLDTNAEGHLDKIELTWIDTATIRSVMPTVTDLIETLRIVSLEGKTVRLNPVALSADPANKTISLVLQENTGGIYETGWRDATVRLTNEPMSVSGRPFEVTRIVDGAGPVIKEVYYVPRTVHDSLVVVFSEPVEWGATGPSQAAELFRHVKQTGNFPLADRSPISTELLADRVVFLLPHGGDISVDKDSIKIDPSATVPTDRSGNPVASTAPPAVVQLGVENQIQASVSNNPFKPGATLIDDQVRSFYTGVVGRERYGTIVALRSYRLLKPRGDGSYGRATIYDALANVVRKDLRVEKAGAGPYDYGIFWDGRNRNGRQVGAGGYLFKIVVSELDGKNIVTRIKVGVKR